MNLIPISSLLELKIVEPKEPTPPKEQARGDAFKKQQSRQKAARTREKKAREERKAAAEKNKLERDARIEKVKEIERAAAGDVKPGLGRIPAQVAHCMMALHVKRGKSKAAAWNICRWALTKNGYLDGPYRVNTKLPKAVKQTGKGSKRSFQHGMEKGPLGGGVQGTGASKFGKFVRMFKSLEPRLLPKEK